MASYELIGLDEATPRLLAPTAADEGVVRGSLSVEKNISDARGSLTAQITPLAQAIAAIFAGATSANTGIQIPSNVQNNHGVNDFTVHWKGYLADYTPSSEQVLRRKHDGTNGYILSILTTGIIRLQLNGFTYDSTEAITTVASDGDVVEIETPVTREKELAAGQVLFIVNGVQLGDAVVIAAGTPTTTDNTTTEYIMGSSTTQTAGGWLQSLTCNRAISALESLQRIKRGVPYGDRGASNISFYPNGNFEDWSGGAPEGWGGGTATTVTEETADPFSGSSYLRLVSGPDPSIQNALFTLSYPLSSARQGNRIRVRFRARRLAGNGDLLAGQGPGSGINAIRFNGSDLDGPAWVLCTADVTVQSGTSDTPRLIFRTALDAAGACTWEIDDFVVFDLGITAQYNAQDIQSDTGQVLESVHGNHGVMPSSRAVRSEPNYNPIIKSSSPHSWTATDEIQYVGLNQNITDSDAAFVTIDIESDAAFSINLGDGSDPDRFVAAYALSIGKNRVTIANPFNDGTNRKLTVQPTTSTTAEITVSCSLVKGV